MVYNRRPKATQSVVQIDLWYLNSRFSKHMTENRSQLNNFINKFLGTIKFGNDQIANTMGYSDYQIKNVTISRVYYVEGLGYNLFSAGQFSNSDLELFVEAVSTACYTQNRSLIRLRYGKTPYELLHDRKTDLSYLHEFSALCYLTNDSEDLGKLKAKADVGIFIGYALENKAYRIYNQHTRRIMETIHVYFDELTTMTSEQSSSGPALHEMTPGTLIPEFAALVSAVSIGLPSSTLVDQDAPSPKPSSEESSSQVVIPNNVHSVNKTTEHISKWTKDHLIDNVIGDPSRPVSTPHQLQNEALFCYFDAFLSSVEPKSYKEALTESCWIEAMQEELNEF
ncbi:retrovirus-related pol polyprotein from transposon TNT 1-94 [Tanacetum coccineum]